MKVALYARVSSEAQDTVLVTSLASIVLIVFPLLLVNPNYITPLARLVSNMRRKSKELGSSFTSAVRRGINNVGETGMSNIFGTMWS